MAGRDRRAGCHASVCGSMSEPFESRAACFRRRKHGNRNPRPRGLWRPVRARRALKKRTHPGCLSGALTGTCFFAGQAIVRPGRVSAMPRSARVVAAGCPHHVTQRGNNRQDVFFLDEDRFACIPLAADRWAATASSPNSNAPWADGCGPGQKEDQGKSHRIQSNRKGYRYDPLPKDENTRVRP
jgi:hypothetical protein